MVINYLILLLLKQHEINIMPFQKGNKVGNRFNKDKQPENVGRPAGVRNRSTIAKEVLNTMLQMPDDIFEKAKEIYPTVQRQLTGEQFATWAVLFKVIRTGDQAALKALLDSAYGNTKQEIDIIGDIKITDNRLQIEVVPATDDED